VTVHHIDEQMSSERTQRRDRRRTAEEADVLACSRKLHEIALEHPRFKAPIDRVINYVNGQLKGTEAKSTDVLRALKYGPLELKELCEDTKLDRLSVLAVTATLEQEGRVQVRDRDGKHVVTRSNGRPWRRPLYRLTPR
jgi:predicted Rossmann fold nucleotide-binding protein DprA/Smf involved in DNA uptake